MSETKRRAPAVFDRSLGEWQPTPQFVFFPEFEQPVPPANPVIPPLVRLLAELEVEFPYIRPTYQRFPYFEQPVPPANPVLGILRSQWVGDAPPFVEGASRYFAFPYFQAPPAAATPLIVFGNAQVLLPGPEPFIAPRYVFVPFVEEVAPPPPPVPLPSSGGAMFGPARRKKRRRPDVAPERQPLEALAPLQAPEAPAPPEPEPQRVPKPRVPKPGRVIPAPPELEPFEGPAPAFLLGGALTGIDDWKLRLLREDEEILMMLAHLTN